MSLQDAITRAPSLDSVAGFLIADLAMGDPAYYGYMTLNGAWMIKCFSEGDGTMRYAFGVDDYATAWAARESLTYDLPGPAV